MKLIVPMILAVLAAGTLAGCASTTGPAVSTDVDATGFPVPVTAVSTHPRDVSRQAMAWLFELLDGNSAEAQVRSVPASITRRGSVRDPAPGPTPPVPPR